MSSASDILRLPIRLSVLFRRLNCPFQSLHHNLITSTGIHVGCLRQATILLPSESNADFEIYHRENELYNIETTQMLQSISIQKSILEVLEDSRAHNQRDRQDDKEAGLLEILASDYKSDKDSISKRVPGKCEW